MTTFAVKTIYSTDATLWSDDTYTLHFGEGFEDQTESTPAELAAAVSRYSLAEILSAGDANDAAKAWDALRLVAGLEYDENTESVILEPGNWHAADQGGAVMEYEVATGEAAAREYVEGGDWFSGDDEPGTKHITVTVWREGIDRNGNTVRVDEQDHTVAINPPEPKCIDRAGHDWQAPHAIVGGIEENPGVWSKGGGITMQEVCVRCGCGRLTDTWASDDNGRQGLRAVSYQPGKYAEEIEEQPGVSIPRGADCPNCGTASPIPAECDDGYCREETCGVWIRHADEE